MEDKSNRNKFIAESMTFNGSPGFYVKQYIDGECVVGQFVPDECYEAFCQYIRTVPELNE